ncbi:hypothetical protein HTT03_15945 [Sulfitobacter sp. S0837]|uniref:hypothetical protein n=1 Tax=Sulfitobacter maritimus TaxID=2741719 RepID=UPI001583CEA8|nr:hypothetical protein [Sulfitobacter maritimus]NUH66774.1 hypothetical protein [Sulfitobacter maritimus]
MRSPLLILGLILPLIASADPFPVQSGEHDGFTRIVTQVPNSDAWDVKQTGRKVTISIKGHQDGFDTSTVFQRIARDRIAAIESRAASLILTLECDCRVSAFPSGSDYAVIDVASPGVALPTPLIALENPRSSETQDQDATTEDSQAKLTPVPPILPLIVKAPKPQKPPQLDLDRTPLTEAQQSALNELQSQLAQELGAASTRGLLTPTARAPSARPRSVEASEPSDPPTTPPEPVDVAQDPLQNMRISSSMDAPMRKKAHPTTRKGQSCPDDASIAIETWGSAEAFDKQISAGRAALFGEFDRIAPQAALSLAQTYLYFGFGAEAQQVLALAPEVARDNPLLFDLADIMDHGEPRRADPLQSFAECESDIALWAVFALESGATSATLPVSSALRTINKLPAHLRRLLAPQLSRRLLSHGYDDAAAAVLRSLERLPDDLPVEATLAQAHVALKEGEIEDGTAKLETVAAQNTPHTPEALIALIEARIDPDEPISAETAALVDTYAQEHRDTTLGAKLEYAHALALIKSGQFDRAARAIKKRNESDNATEKIALNLNFLKELTGQGDDIVFLDHILDFSEEDIAQLPKPDIYDLVTRLLSLGFAAEAQRILATESETDRPLRRQLLAARTALALQQPFQAQAALLGIDAPEASPLRAQAKAMAGEFGEAHDLYQQSNLASSAQDTAWLANDWRDRTPKDSPIYGATARLVESRPALSDDPNGMLARTKAALSESAAARGTLDKLLSATALTQDATE